MYNQIGVLLHFLDGRISGHGTTHITMRRLESYRFIGFYRVVYGHKTHYATTLCHSQCVWGHMFPPTPLQHMTPVDHTHLFDHHRRLGWRVTKKPGH